MDICNNNNNNNNSNNNDSLNGLKLLEDNSNRLLTIILNSQVGVSEITLKRKVTELSERTEKLKKLQLERSNLINQIQIESNRLKYLESLESNRLIGDSEDKKKQKEETNEKKEEQDIENELLESICNLKEKLFSLSTSRTEQQSLFNRIYQSKLIEHLLSSTTESNNSSKILKLSKIRDEGVEICLKLISQIELNNDEILKIRKKRIEEMKLNRETYNNLKMKLEESKSKTEREQKNYSVLKDKTSLLGFIIQNLVYESGIDWVKDDEITYFFDTIDNFGDDIELDENENENQNDQDNNNTTPRTTTS
ncbi:hypothetical protein DICPUDRAFT_149723 [Dictyostelium purpureum]|uniref:Centromere protein H C-terminal domain-containing protein n=1 Tax=Dictyostelium purpureum TaxID=5786 RepID=F0ZEI0_DICPU|nr:uncharacterized protein DICPUDRAFT_149723 [Dictyostelium purpureum]EGC37650.1 hypothetical protein DICPUDRAFT_149723 [Dictyostelium purpureum]|eukprot:XP_003285838.1 hypothetical protein DICPUDRAFT_149723 [Dictyostelium purpureum]